MLGKPLKLGPLLLSLLLRELSLRNEDDSLELLRFVSWSVVAPKYEMKLSLLIS